MTFALQEFEQAVASANPSPPFINLWHNYLQKFLKPLLLAVSPPTLERLATKNISKWMQILDGSVDGIGTTQWLWQLLNRSLIFYLLVTLYNRLPKTTLHGLHAGSVGPVLKAFLGPSKVDLIQTGQNVGIALTAAIMKYSLIL